MWLENLIFIANWNSRVELCKKANIEENNDEKKM